MPAGSKPPQSDLLLDSRSSLRRKLIVLSVVLAIVSIATLPLGSTEMTFHSVDDITSTFATAIKLAGDALGGTFYTNAEINKMCPAFYDVCGRVATLYIAILCGGMLTLAGSLYQTVFRNPIAAPTLLGVGNGVTLGIVVLVFIYGLDAAYHVPEHYLLCYSFALVVLGIVIGIAVIIGRGSPSVTDMLLVGTVFSGVLGQAIVFFTYFVFTDAQWDVYNNANEVLSVGTDRLSLLVLTLVFLVATTPVILARFRLNLVAFEQTDMRMSGANPTGLRIIALGCATILVIGAQIHMGTISMVALAVPFLSRLVFGAEFSRQAMGDLLLGAIVVVICNALVSFANILLFQNEIYISLPIGLIANLVTLPLFAWIMASQKRGWE